VLRGIPGLELLEFSRSRELSLCCEGGGGRMWVEGTGQGPRNSELRVQEAEAMGAEVIATACPFCLLNLEDAVKTTGLEGKVQVKDILELLAEALQMEV
ncbi:MAG: Fe-S oxidoreductase, partial [Deltaproteobacteria bacterium]